MSYRIYLMSISLLFISSNLIPASRESIIIFRESACSAEPDTSFNDASRITGVLRSDLQALAQIESEHMQSTFSKTSLKWEPVRSSSGALGIMQIKPATWDWMDCQGSIKNRHDNVLCSARYLARIRRMRCTEISGRSQLRCMIAHYHDGHNKKGQFSDDAVNHVRKFIRATEAPVFI